MDVNRRAEPWRLCRFEHGDDSARRLALGLDDHFEVDEVDAAPSRRADNDAFIPVRHATRLSRGHFKVNRFG
jgi:hypothetical protein